MIDHNKGASSVIISIPHSGTEIPDVIATDMTDEGETIVDTDWFVDRLYAFSSDLDVTTIKTNINRYVIDMNRDPEDKSLYPGQFTTGLCPEVTFTGKALYREKSELSKDEIAIRKEQFWQPYHALLMTEINRIKQLHGFAVLLDAHSIASTVPTLFNGKLPDLNFGTNDGISCEGSLLNCIHQETAKEFSKVINGRFKGGYITRHYGKPENSVHTIQLEISQDCYLNETDATWNDTKANKLIEYLQQFCSSLIDWRPYNNK